MESLWGEAFEVKDTAKEAKKIIEKIKKPKKIADVPTARKLLSSRTIPMATKLQMIKEEVLKKLGIYKDRTILLRTREQLHSYIDAAITNNIIAIDTETNNSLDPITCKLMGPCIYTPGQKNAYIPINHIDPYTRELLPNQLTEKDIEEEFKRLKDTFIIMHNGKFDYKVLYCTCNLDLDIAWDTMIAAKLLDENELSAGLKQQYIEKIDPSIEKYSIDELFKDIEYAVVDPEIFALYAATDPYMTYKLYEWQKDKLEQDNLKGVYRLFKTIEMPVVKVIAKMELNGVELDKQYAKLLSKKYHRKLDTLDKQAEEEIARLQPQIDAWRLSEDANKKQLNRNGNEGKTKNEQLENPIKLSSPTQLAILLYDVLKVESVDKKSPRGTGEDILEKINLPLCKILIERRHVSKLLDAFIDALPQTVNEKTGRVHCSFNQYGAATGRLSCSEPNLQQIPSHEKSIRMLFKAADGNVLVGSDFSQQEPRLLSQFAHDENMINAYKQGKDLYATIASGVYNTTYEECLEHHADGTLYKEGKARRSSVKSLLLGIMYGRGVKSIAEQIHGTVEEAQKIIDDFYKSFPKVKEWMDNTQVNAHKNGYVEDLWGRRRRLPDIMLPKYEIIDKNNKNASFNPFLICEDKPAKSTTALKYETALAKIKNRRDYELIKQQALKDNIEIKDNSGFIAQAERQAVNARIQGSAASMTKAAMVKLDHDQQLKDWGFKLLIGVHDELIGECPLQYAQQVAERLCDVMKAAAEDVCEVPFKCDPDISTCWYLNEYVALVQGEFDKLKETGLDDLQAFNQLCEDRCESTRDQVYEIVQNQMSIRPEGVVDLHTIV